MNRRSPTNSTPDPALGPPVIPGKIVAVGLNYSEHASESGVDTPPHPLLFAKYPSAVIGPRDEIVIDSQITSRPDWEVELAVVVGRRMRNVPADHTLEHVFGYTVANDVSARDLQFARRSVDPGKEPRHVLSARSCDRDAG